MEALFERVQERYPGAASKLQKSKAIIRFNCSDPDAILVINGRRNPTMISYGEKRIRPEVDVYIAADTLHYVLLGGLRITEALKAGDLKVKGSVHKALSIADLFHQCQEIYPEILRQQGLVSETKQED